VSKAFEASKTFRTFTFRQQAYALLLLGVVCLVLAWLLHPNPFSYPLGVLLLGIGMLIAALLNPGRLVIAASLTTALGIAVFLGFKHLIPGSQIFPSYILAIGVALLAIALAARRGYIGKGAVTPGIIVIVAGIIEVLLVGGLTPPAFLPFMLSLWLPGCGLLLLGIIYFLIGGINRRA
jgi:hypothetical protein